MKKLLTLATTFATVSTFAACGKKGTSGSKTGALAIIVSEKSNEFFSDMIKGATEQVSKYSGEKIQVFDSQSKSENELKHVKTAISNGAKAILLNVENSDTSKAAVQHAISKGVKVVLLDRTLTDNSVAVSGAIYTDNKVSASALGKYATEFLSAKSFTYDVNNGLQLQGPSGHSASIARDAGWPEGFTAWGSTTKERANWDTQKGYDITKTKLTSNPDLNVIFAENDNMAVGAQKALKEKFSDKTLIEHKKFIFGFDGTKDAKALVDKGEMVATVVQEPYKMGAYGVDWAMKLLDKEYKNKDVLTESELSDKTIQLTGKIYKK